MSTFCETIFFYESRTQKILSLTWQWLGSYKITFENLILLTFNFDRIYKNIMHCAVYVPLYLTFGTHLINISIIFYFNTFLIRLSKTTYLAEFLLKAVSKTNNRGLFGAEDVSIGISGIDSKVLL